MRSTLLLAACLLFAACDSQSVESGLTGGAVTANAGGSGPSASGHTNLTVGGGLQTFSFHAREHRDGDVRGTFQVKSRGQNTTAHGTIECLTVVGNMAYLNGTVTRVNEDNPYGLEPGQRVYFGVQDNGEGQGATDAWTDLLFAGAYSACEDLGFALIPNEGGNIQVRP